MKIELSLPEDIELNCSEHDLKMYIAVSLYEKGILDSGYAAKLIGMERNSFINQMADYGKSIFDLPDYETEKDFLNA